VSKSKSNMLLIINPRT